MTKILSHLLSLSVGAVLTFLLLADKLGQYETDNAYMVTQLAKYEATVYQMETQGWSKTMIEEYVNRGCIPLLYQGE